MTIADEFAELLAVAIHGANRMLRRPKPTSHLFVLGYIAEETEFDISVGLCDLPEELPGLIESVEETLRQRVVELSGLACCLVIPGADRSACTMWLETRYNECGRIRFRLTGEPLQLDEAGIEAAEGMVRIFAVRT